QRRPPRSAPAAGRLDRGHQGPLPVGAVGAHRARHQVGPRDPDAAQRGALMGLELELELEDEASIFSATTVRAHLNVAGRPVSAFRDTLAWGRERLYGLFTEGTSAESLVRARSFLVDEVLREAWLKFLPERPAGL